MLFRSTNEIEAAGFKVLEEPKFLKENYCVIFQKVEVSKDTGR